MKRGAVAWIDEARCIGCTLCIEACPVDAITGARGLLHTVVAGWCIGCRLCLPPCPVDCIAMVAPPAPWGAADARAAQRRYVARRVRRARSRAEAPVSDARERRAVIAALLGRGSGRRARPKEGGSR